MGSEKQITQSPLDHRLKSLHLITFYNFASAQSQNETPEHHLCIKVFAKIYDLRQFRGSPVVLDI